MRGATTSLPGSGPPRVLAREGQEPPPVASLPEKRAAPVRGKRGGRADSFHFRVTGKERAEIEEAANKAGLAPGSYARGKLLGGNPPRAVRALPIERQALALLLAQIGRVGGNLNQLAKAGNSGLPVDAADVAPALADLRAIRDEIRALLGRKPL
jgi:hypothetical protein